MLKRARRFYELFVLTEYKNIARTGATGFTRELKNTNLNLLNPDLKKAINYFLEKRHITMAVQMEYEKT